MSTVERDGHVEVYRDDTGEWRWRRVAANGETIASGEGYVRRIDALEIVGREYGGVPVVELNTQPGDKESHT